MAVNPDITQNIELYPILADVAIAAGRAVVASTPNAGAEQRGKQATSAGQNAVLATVQRFLGISKEATADGVMTSIQRHGRVRCTGGGVITAPALVTWDAAGKLVTFTVDGTKFGYVVGYAATDCAGDDGAFDLILCPMIIGPASADSVNFTLTGIIQALTGIITGALTVGTTLGVTGASHLVGDLTEDGNIIQSGAKYHEMTEMAAPAAPAANKGRLFLVDVAGKTALQVIFQSGAAQQIAVEP